MIKIKSCLMCKNYAKRKIVDQCSAFPKGIPFAIVSTEFVHIKKYPNQENDIVFEPIKGK